jgi:hypothetical protein
LTKPSGSASQKTTDFPSYPMKISVTCQPITSLETVFPPRRIPNEHVHSLVDLSPYANVTTQADAPVTPANTPTFAPHAMAGTLGRSAEDTSDPSPPSEQQHWEQPKWARGFLWAENAASHTPSASSTELADLFPTVPDSVLRDNAAAQTIVDHPSLFQVITPIDVDPFETLLTSHSNRPLIHSVCKSLQEGVWPCTALDESAPVTFDFSKREVSPAGLMFLCEQCDIEIACDCYSPTFGPDLLPGMYSMPVGVVPKPHSDKFRLVNDLSA